MRRLCAGWLRPDLAIFAVFFLESSVLGHWVPRIPDIKAALGLGDADLGIALLAMPAGTLVGLSIAGALIGLTGLRNACRISMPAWALLFIGPALAPGFAWLFLALFLTGLAIGWIETAMNTEAARIEGAIGRRLMSKAHGFWSLGSMCGALLGAAVAQLGVSVAMHFLLFMPPTALLGYLAATALPLTNESGSPADRSVSAVAEPGPTFRLPDRTIMLLCVMPLGIMAVEGAFIDWSALFMREVLEASPLLTGVIYAVFSIVMALTRLAGDRLAEHFGDREVARASGMAAAAGICLFALAPSSAVALLAAAIAGAGVALVFPLAVSAAAARPGRNPADNVAALNMVSFSAFLFAPPVIGFLSEAADLRWALLALVPGAMVTALLAGELRPRRVALAQEA